MDKYNKSVQHNWFHHATWGDSKYKSEGVGKVLWHSLTEDGKVEIVDIQFGDSVYEGVSVNHLKPVQMEAHGHPAAKKKKKVDDAKNEVKEITINGKKYRAVKWEELE